VCKKQSYRPPFEPLTKFQYCYVILSAVKRLIL
jgi:hypothetical protein